MRFSLSVLLFALCSLASAKAFDEIKIGENVVYASNPPFFGVVKNKTSAIYIIRSESIEIEHWLGGRQTVSGKDLDKVWTTDGCTTYKVCYGAKTYVMAIGQMGQFIGFRQAEVIGISDDQKRVLARDISKIFVGDPALDNSVFAGIPSLNTEAGACISPEECAKGLEVGRKVTTNPEHDPTDYHQGTIVGIFPEFYQGNNQKVSHGFIIKDDNGETRLVSPVRDFVAPVFDHLYNMCKPEGALPCIDEEVFYVLEGHLLKGKIQISSPIWTTVWSDGSIWNYVSRKQYPRNVFDLPISRIGLGRGCTKDSSICFGDRVKDLTQNEVKVIAIFKDTNQVGIELKNGEIKTIESSALFK